jgi:uncharacterized protein with GYD domain
MPKYLFMASYTQSGVQGLLKDGGTGRRKAVEQLAKGFGGSLDAFYFGFGGEDVYAIVDAPDNVTIAAASLAVAAAGAVTIRTVVLLTPEEIDQATKKTVDYRPPGG